MLPAPCAGYLLRASRTVPYVTFGIEPIDIEHVPSPSPFNGRFDITHAMTPNNTRKVLHGHLKGPEHIAVAPVGFAHPAEVAARVWTAVENGTLYSVQLEKGDVRPETLAEELYIGPGRPLGFTWDADGGMYICNSLQVRTGARLLQSLRYLELELPPCSRDHVVSVTAHAQQHRTSCRGCSTGDQASTFVS